jgi:dolichyl-phosphate-mannose-protein mannosyltransferase
MMISKDYSVRCGDAIRLKHSATPSYYLNSDNFKWSSGSGQQVVTLKKTNSDLSSLWQVQEGYKSTCKVGKPIQCGEVIRFMHLATKKRLHSHDFRSALSQAQEVSGFGDDTGEYGVEGGDKSDDWQVICDGENWVSNEKVQFLHVETGAYLR